MSNFIRPEAKAALWQWRETIVGAGLIVLGIWWILGPGQLMTIVGSLAAFAGAALSFVGLQRARFRGPEGGVGSVDVDEGQVTYFGPMTGGAVALRDMTELALLRTGVTTHWRLTAAQDILYIPSNADGVDALFDAFTTLPGLQVERMLSALNSAEISDYVIWQRTARAPEFQLH